MILLNRVLYILIIVLLTQCHSERNIDDFSWPNVKPENKPGTYWWWMGSGVDKENLTYNLETLAVAGIGNVHIIPIYGVEGEENRFIDFLSPDWMDMLAYTVDEGSRLSMNVDMSTTTGWPFGGSHVNVEDAASKIEFKVYYLSKGEKVNEELSVYNIQAVVAYSPHGESINLTDKLNSEGVLNWVAPQDDWQVYVLSLAGTGQLVKRAAPGNIGLVLDPFSVGSLKNYLARYDKAFANYNGGKLRAQYHDSYEYYNANWTDRLFQEFEIYNGYDLRLYLKELFSKGELDIDKRIKADYRRVLAGLHLEYITEWNAWSHEHGWITRNEGHGAPANLLDLYAASDIPETETFGSRLFDIPGLRYEKANNSTSAPPNPLILKFASSAAHITGKPLIASETNTWLREHFKASLSQVKPEIGQLFLSGINHIFYHGNAYSPRDAVWPGWLFYASTHFEKENAFWRDFPELNKYVTRCQSILQGGKPANDILLYWPFEDVIHGFSDALVKTLNVHDIEWFTDSEFGMLAKYLDKEGYSFDYISDRQLEEVEFEGESLTTGGNKYKTILVPKTEYIPLSTWKKLMQLAESGAAIIFQNNLPADVPGLLGMKERRDELSRSKNSLAFHDNNKDFQIAKVGEGTIYLCNEAKAALNSVNVNPEEMVNNGLRYIKRTHEEGLHYFIANLNAKPFSGWILLNEKFNSAVILDPRTSNRAGMAATRINNGRQEIFLQAQPGESFIVRTFSNLLAEGNAWRYTEPAGQPLEITGNWHVEFIEGGPEFPADYNTSSLQSWTTCGDSSALSFAGTARYSTSFILQTIGAEEYQLSLGKVCESARVKINGRDVGTLWSFPFNIQVGWFLNEGENVLEIEVTNLSANRLRSLDLNGEPWKKFFFVNIFYKDFDAANWPLMDSGLLGPVHLTPLNILFNKP